MKPLSCDRIQPVSAQERAEASSLTCRRLILAVISAVLYAISRISVAMTENPRPCTPALDADVQRDEFNLGSDVCIFRHQFSDFTHGS